MLLKAISKIYSTFLSLLDTPSTYSGQGGKYVKVNTGETGLEFGTGGGSLWTQSGSDIYYTTGNVGIGTTAPTKPLEVYANAGTLIDGSSWNSSFFRYKGNMSLAGTATAGSANEFGVNIQTNITAATSSGASYQKSALIGYGRTNDPSDYGLGIMRDVTGADLRGYIASTNSLGRAWGMVAFTHIESGGDGYTVGIEVDSSNYGTDQPVLDTSTCKTGIQVVGYGTAPSTVAYRVIGVGAALWHKGFFAKPTDFTTTGNFIELENSFVISWDGKLKTLLSFNGTTHAGLRLNNLTTAQKTALTPSKGMAVYDTTLNKFYGYGGSPAAWAELGGGNLATFGIDGGAYSDTYISTANVDAGAY